MCISAIAWQLFDDMPLVILSNRDEFYARPTLPAHQWQDAPIYAGRDKKSGGTWLGIHQQVINQPITSQPITSQPITSQPITNQQVIHQTVSHPKQTGSLTHQNGRWAMVLNFRDGVEATSDQRSRGALVTEFLTSDVTPLSYARQIDLKAYAGFNLVIGDEKQAVLVNNRGYPPTLLHSGLHMVSNGQPDSAWFKSERLRGRVRQEVLPLIAERLTLSDTDDDYWLPAAWQVLSDTTQAPDDQLPDTGVQVSLEKQLSAICIDTEAMPTYGTRTQSILTLKSVSQQPNADQLQANLHLSLIQRDYSDL